MADIFLTASVRSNLLALQNTSSLVGRTQGRLSTGLAVSSPIDNAVKYFQSKALGDRATDLAGRKDGIDQGVNSLGVASQAITTMEDLVTQMKGILDNARSGTQAQRKEYNKQFGEIASQIQKLVDDASYQGLNLLNSTSSTLSVRFSDKSTSKLEVSGYNLNSSALFLNSQGTGALGVANASTVSVVASYFGFTTAGLSVYTLTQATVLACFNERVDTALEQLDQTVSDIRAKSATLGNNVAILQVRLDFTSNYVNTLQEGGDKLRLADLNEEGANLLALQTRQQLGIQALAFAGQAEQAILGLFR
ncbi:MAG: flagellin [Rhodospirillales bacterium]|nr:flagellin [Rhodospirillales bacterium]MCW8952910.1 flagellin [Rhodospirillales bacterium]MCW8970260.1 flagellin [Rhodospirillales bacterium]MCW9002560.1 flagellin [Rhodospirillales bacterium]MCW9039919.1 flagellin [Rhodospirillales bacterium]